MASALALTLLACLGAPLAGPLASVASAQSTSSSRLAASSAAVAAVNGSATSASTATKHNVSSSSTTTTGSCDCGRLMEPSVAANCLAEAENCSAEVASGCCVPTAAFYAVVIVPPAAVLLVIVVVTSVCYRERRRQKEQQQAMAAKELGTQPTGRKKNDYTGSKTTPVVQDDPENPDYAVVPETVTEETIYQNETDELYENTGFGDCDDAEIQTLPVAPAPPQAVGSSKAAVGSSTAAVGSSKAAVGSSKAAVGGSKAAVGSSKAAVGSSTASGATAARGSGHSGGAGAGAAVQAKRSRVAGPEQQPEEPVYENLSYAAAAAKRRLQ